MGLANLGLTLKTRLASNSQNPTCLCLPSNGIKGAHHHIWLKYTETERENFFYILTEVSPASSPSPYCPPPNYLLLIGLSVGEVSITRRGCLHPPELWLQTVVRCMSGTKQVHRKDSCHSCFQIFLQNTRR